MKMAKTRDKIIETASELFYQKGYNLTGINEIIAEAGIAKATLYSHFKSKEDLCIAYLQYKNNTFLTELEQFCKAKTKGKAQVLAIFDFLKLFFQDKDFNGCWCLRTVSEIPRENETIRKEIQGQKADFLNLIQQIIKENKIKEKTKEVEIVARQIYLLYESAVAESHLHQEEWPIVSAKKIAKQILAL